MKASVTRFAKSLKDPGDKKDEPKTLTLAQHLSKCLKTLDREFKEHHDAIVDRTALLSTARIAKKPFRENRKTAMMMRGLCS